MYKRLFIMIGIVGLCMTGFGLIPAFGGVMIEEEKKISRVVIGTAMKTVMFHWKG
jgi:hypothetical protein